MEFGYRCRRETVDCCVVWMPEHRVAIVSNLLARSSTSLISTLFEGTVRSVEPQASETNRMVRSLRPESS